MQQAELVVYVESPDGNGKLSVRTPFALQLLSGDDAAAGQFLLGIIRAGLRDAEAQRQAYLNKRRAP